MATFYVRMTGSDANAGTSAAAAWRTIGKALSTNGISSGDTVYIGAGIYRETVVCNVTSPTVETSIIGDIDGTYTGDAGDVEWTAYTRNDKVSSSATTLLNISAKDFLTFRNITFISGTATMITATTTTSTDIKFINCNINCLNSSNSAIDLTVGFGVAANWVIDSCVFYCNTTIFNITLTTGSGADYNANILINNCSFIGAGGIVVTSSGSSANEGGGVIVSNCFFYASSTAVSTTTTRVGGQNFNYPVLVYNCVIFARIAAVHLSAGELGALVEYNNFMYGGGKTSVGSSIPSINGPAPLLHFPKKFSLQDFFGIPSKKSPILARGDKTIASPYGIDGNPRSIGTNFLAAKGTATSATPLSLTDTSQNFGSGAFNGYTLKITEGAGAGQTKTIWSNTSNTVSGDGAWLSTPDSTSKYIIFQGQTSSTGPVSAATSTTIISSGANWTTNFWQGYTCLITSGAAVGKSFIVTGNSLSGLTGYFPMTTTPSVGDAYSLFWGAVLRSTVSTGTNITLTDNNASWPNSVLGAAGSLIGYRCMITSGVASGANFVISGYSNNTLSGWNTFSVVPATGDQYAIYFNTGDVTGYYASGYVPQFSKDFMHCAAGCYEKANTAVQETGIVKSGSNSLQIFGPGTQNFYIPISGNTTISVMAYFDATYSGIKPQLILYGGSGISVPDTTGTMVGGSGQWEQITLTVAPSSAGYINAQLRSNATGCGASAYFDSFSVV